MDGSNNEKSSARDIGSSSNKNSFENDTQRQFTSTATFSGLTAASPPKFISLEEILSATNGMKNMALAHEIAIDKDFQLQKLEPESGTFHKRVKENMHKAFWDLLSEQLNEDPPNYTQALVLLQEIKETLDELVLPHHTKIKENIKEVLDVDLIKQQAEKGVLDFQHYAQFVIYIMSKVCAPVRDDQIKDLAKKTDVIEVFKGIMEVLQLMMLDLANYTITMMRPNIIAASIEYERAKFAEFLKIQADGLYYTKKWLLKNLDPDKISESLDDKNAVKQIAHSLLAKAYLDLLDWDSSPEAETLMLDQGRLLELRDKINRIVIIGSIILVVYNTVGTAIHGVSSFKLNLKKNLSILLESVHSNKDLESALPNIILQLKTEIKSTLEQIGAPPMASEAENILEGQLKELVDSEHKIRKLVYLRIRQFLQNIILSQSAAPRQVPPGLSSVQEELTAIAARFLILVAHNRSVFGEYYQEIITNALTNKNPTDSIYTNQSMDS